MKKLVLSLLVSILLTTTGFPAIVIRDPVVFYSLYGKPDTVIDFFKLKDGTFFNNIPDSYHPNTSYQDNPDNLIIYTGQSDGGGGFELVAVRSQAFSDDWSFKTVHPQKPGIFREFVVWFADGITTGSNEMAISSPTHQSQPFVIYTEKGFMGVVPNSPQETLFIFEDFHIVSRFETGFSKGVVDPEPPSAPFFWEKVDGYQKI